MDNLLSSTVPSIECVRCVHPLGGATVRGAFPPATLLASPSVQWVRYVECVRWVFWDMGGRVVPSQDGCPRTRLGVILVISLEGVPDELSKVIGHRREGQRLSSSKSGRAPESLNR